MGLQIIYKRMKGIKRISKRIKFKGIKRNKGIIISDDSLREFPAFN